MTLLNKWTPSSFEMLPLESAETLRSLTLAVFDFSHRLELLHVTDVISSFHFFSAAASPPRPHAAWPRLRHLNIRDTVWSSRQFLNMQSSAATFGTSQDVLAAIAKSLDHMLKIQKIEVSFHRQGEKGWSWIKLEVRTNSHSSLCVFGLQISQEDLAPWKGAVERLGGQPLELCYRPYTG